MVRTNRWVLVVGLVVALGFGSATAHAERESIVTFSGGLSAIGPLDAPDGTGGPEHLGLQLRGTMSWEEPPLSYQEPKGYRFAGTVVPEIFAGMVSTGDDRSELVGGGLRFELAFSQRRMGLLEVSARGGCYVAARGGLFTDPARTPFAEGALGEYFLVGDTARLGLELGVMGIYAARDEEEWVIRGALAGPPFEQGRGTYLNVNAALYLGIVL